MRQKSLPNVMLTLDANVNDLWLWPMNLR